MKYLEDKNEKKAALISLAIHLILTFLFLFFGFTYLDPKPEEGIMVRFGEMADVGGSAPERMPEQTRAQPQTSQPQVNEQVASQFTQTDTDAPTAVTQKKETKKEPQKPVEKVEEKKPEEEKPEEKKPTVDDRLRQIMSGQGQTSNKQGSGDGQKEGTQGNPTGNSNTGANEGDGVGVSGQWVLGGRGALSKPIPDYPCAEEGRVVVRVSVDINGRTVAANPGGSSPDGKFHSTTTSSCLYDKARQAALATRWKEDPNAQEIQLGYIVYYFKKR